ncbi:NADH-quinone oxidoreductase subunit M [Candidatus Fokinia solitaria]|uniref:NADH-quinone oxidoreductase subunit M n=1 Tax=Candidatus Fokinia solitaria TaxID=1802984 RepID=A0A2U8BRV2_9RICK|nr:NADH-quinone oxidoreductase subunit M [Candidatus Fokinia solitaria]AWD33071.1 NADH-quinone oxidoreductase subunit M [Candidatus Fokinia solitaria]
MHLSITSFPLISFSILLSILCAVFSFLVISITKEKKVYHILKYQIISCSFITFLSSIVMFVCIYNAQDGKFLFSELHTLCRLHLFSTNGSIAVNHSVRLDYISAVFVLLTTSISSITILFTFFSGNRDEAAAIQQSSLFLIIQGMLINLFTTQDLLVFYTMFELVLVPTFIIIGKWGDEGRVYATFKFLMYTIASSVIMLWGITYIMISYSTLDINTLANLISVTIPSQNINYLALSFFIPFAVKTPIPPFHTWLPKAHVEAPTSCSMILAALLLKIGCFGFIKIFLPFFPTFIKEWQSILVSIVIAGGIYASLITLVQFEAKKIVAYSSITHMSFVIAGLFSLNSYGFKGAIFQMLSHGVVSCGLFAGLGILHTRVHTYNLYLIPETLGKRMPMLASTFAVFTLSAIGVPLTSGFIGEFTTIFGVYHFDKVFGFLLSINIVLSAIYMLMMYSRIFFSLGLSQVKISSELRDSSKAEFYILLAIVIISVSLGINPKLEKIFS